MWVPTTTPLPTLVAEQHPSKVRLDLSDGTHVEIEWPAMVGDSMVGSDSTAVTPVYTRDVSTVKVQEFSLIKTVVLAITVPMATIGLICVIAGDGSCYIGD
jgi:hypothetical protein